MSTNNEILEVTLEAQRLHWGDFVSEMLKGKKETHWCWFMFPNVPGLGSSDNAKKYAVTPSQFVWMMQNSQEYCGNILAIIRMVDWAYRTHPSLDLEEILGEVDVLKFKSFLTLVRVPWFHGKFTLPPIVEDIVRTSDKVYGRCSHTVEQCKKDFNETV